jgi:uncharacterized protein (TIGR00661 family)
MNVLYAIQGTGNGHLSRAEEIVPILGKYSNTTVLVSGNQSQLHSNFEINYKRTGLTFLSGKNGKVDLLRTVIKSHPLDFLNETRKFPIKNFDLIITDFEPVSAWSALIHGVPCIEMSHQAAVIHPDAPKPETKSRLGEYILNHYCPTKEKIGFHFESFNEKIFTPVIQNDIRKLTPTSKGHYTVYLPAFHDEVIVQFLKQFPVKWEVFSKYTQTVQTDRNVTFYPIDKVAFTTSVEACEGVFCGAGFELPSEAIFLGKKLLIVPMKGQYEQLCNAEAAKRMGATVIENLTHKDYQKVYDWLSHGLHLTANYENNTDLIVQNILLNFEESRLRNKQKHYEALGKSKLDKLSVLKYLF